MTRGVLSLADLATQVALAVAVHAVAGYGAGDLLARIGFSVPLALTFLACWRLATGASGWIKS